MRILSCVWHLRCDWWSCPLSLLCYRFCSGYWCRGCCLFVWVCCPFFSLAHTSKSLRLCERLWVEQGWLPWVYLKHADVSSVSSLFWRKLGGTWLPVELVGWITNDFVVGVTVMSLYGGSASPSLAVCLHRFLSIACSGSSVPLLVTWSLLFWCRSSYVLSSGYMGWSLCSALGDSFWGKGIDGC